MIKPIPEDVLDAIDEVEHYIGREETLLIMGWLSLMLERGENISLVGTDMGVAVIPYMSGDDDIAYGVGDNAAEALHDALNNHEQWRNDREEKARIAFENWERRKDYAHE